jgi:cyclopropane-fatty-acyl-phospholipid synthase
VEYSRVLNVAKVLIVVKPTVIDHRDLGAYPTRGRRAYFFEIPYNQNGRLNVNSPCMNQTSVISTAAKPHSEPASMAQRLVMPTLQRMTQAGLRLTLPDGSQHQWGDQSSPLQAEIMVRRDGFFQKVLRYGDIGFGEAYVDGDWDTPSIANVISWAIANIDHSPGFSGGKAKAKVLNFLRSINRIQHLLRPNSKAVAQRNIAEHYDLGNDFYQLWLDETLTYSSGIFASPETTLAESQLAKYEALCHKTKICATDHVLEIGTGWGGFACYAAGKYGCRVTTVTISKKQHEYATARVESEGLGHLVSVKLQDYRDIPGQFDKIISIEMMEALGDKYLLHYCQQLHRLLSPHGLVGLQYITVPDSRHQELRGGVDWIQKHIFPGSLLLSIGRVSERLRQTGNLFLHDLHDIGLDYSRTLHLWWETFNTKLAEVRSLGFDDKFIRKWNYYLQYCDAAFATRNISVVQAIYTRPNNKLLAR